MLVYIEKFVVRMPEKSEQKRRSTIPKILNIFQCEFSLNSVRVSKDYPNSRNL